MSRSATAVKSLPGGFSAFMICWRERGQIGTSLLQGYVQRVADQQFAHGSRCGYLFSPAQDRGSIVLRKIKVYAICS